MIRFWWKEVFQIPEVQELQYYCRFDSDSYLMQPIHEDFFKTMEKHKYKYGYRVEINEPHFVIVDLEDFVEAYMNDHPATKLTAQQNDFNLSPRPERSSADLKIFYNNFEVVHVPTFIGEPAIQAFVDAVDNTGNIYARRWGDAPLRTVLCKLFLHPHEIHKFCNFDYYHQGLHKRTC